MNAHAPRGGVAARLSRGLFVTALCVAGFALVWLGRTTSSLEFDPIQIEGPIVYVPDDQGGRIYEITSQWRRKVRTGRFVSPRPYASEQSLDLWAFRASDLTPVWRRRISEGPIPVMESPGLLGAHATSLWLFLGGRLRAVKLETGETLIDTAGIEGVNPELKGLMSGVKEQYAFDASGLVVTAADGRPWRLDPATFGATPIEAAAAASETAHPPAQFIAFTDPSFISRGIDRPGQWCGLLTPEEAAAFEARNSIQSIAAPAARRLWKTASTEIEEFFHKRLDYFQPAPLPSSPEFFSTGLLCHNHYDAADHVIWGDAPESVFVVHRKPPDPLLRLARVSASDGAVLWDSELPLTRFQSVVSARSSLVIFGIEEAGSPDVARERLISVDLASGALGVHRHESIESHIDAAPLDDEP